jgi:hypothetical protein
MEPKLLSEQLHKKSVIKFQEDNYHENLIHNESEKRKLNILASDRFELLFN